VQTAIDSPRQYESIRKAELKAVILGMCDWCEIVVYAEQFSWSQTGIQGARNLIPGNAKLLPALAFLTRAFAAHSWCPLAFSRTFCWRRGDRFLVSQWAVTVVQKVCGWALFGRGSMGHLGGFGTCLVIGANARAGGAGGTSELELDEVC
jgi:hypothetical protein